MDEKKGSHTMLRITQIQAKIHIVILFFLNLTTKYAGLGFFPYLTNVMHPEGQENVKNVNYGQEL